LEAQGTAVVGRVLSGLGGVGKTQLAADYALTEFRDGRLDVLVWIAAATRQAVVDGYARAAVELLGSERDEHAAQRFLSWLQASPSRPVCRWLVVLDDLSDPMDLTGLWPPACPDGRTVVTTRRRDAALTGLGRRRVDVGVFTPAEAAAALREALVERDHPAQDDVQIRALATELGFLPLALSQAAAYIADAGIGIADYRARLADRARLLADLLPRPTRVGQGEAGDTLPDGQVATVAATWSLSVERADQLHPQGLAHLMLQLVAVLDPNGIPQAVVTSAPALQYLTANRTSPLEAMIPVELDAPGRAAPARGEVDAEDAVAALRALHRLSLVEHTLDQPNTAIRVHQLVQRTTYEALTVASQEQLVRTVADALLTVWPGLENDTGFVQALRANAATLDRAPDRALHTPDVHMVLFRVGFSLGDAGQAAAARDHFQALCARSTQLLGPNHPDTLAARSHVAQWRGEAGDAVGAVSDLTELLPELERALGQDHPDILTARGNLAGWRGQSGDTAGAAAAYAELLPELVRVQGPDYPDTLTARSQLVQWRGRAGDVAGAVSDLTELLKDLMRVMSPDHPYVLNARSNLADWRGQAGDVVGAVGALTELLKDQTRVLGPDHPHTLITRSQLAQGRGRAGDVVGAVGALTELLKDQTRVLGPDHPHTLTTRGNLAAWRGRAGDAAGAVSAFTDLLPDMVRVLGPDHPHTLAAASNFAQWRGKAGDAVGAVNAFADLLPELVRVLGPDHPHTLLTRGNFAQYQEEAGDAVGAVSALTELLKDQTRVLGPEHPETLATRANLAGLWGRMGDAAEAARALAELLDDQIRVLGPDHPHNVHVREGLAKWQAEAITDGDEASGGD
jgi:Tetratricopeptide repeat